MHVVEIQERGTRTETLSSGFFARFVEERARDKRRFTVYAVSRDTRSIALRARGRGIPAAAARNTSCRICRSDQLTPGGWEKSRTRRSRKHLVVVHDPQSSRVSRVAFTRRRACVSRALCASSFSRPSCLFELTLRPRYFLKTKALVDYLTKPSAIFDWSCRWRILADSPRDEISIEGSLESTCRRFFETRELWCKLPRFADVCLKLKWSVRGVFFFFTEKSGPKMVPSQQDSSSNSGIPMFGSLLVDKNSPTPYSDATQV